MESVSFVREYLLLGLGFDRLEEGFVDAYTGDPALRRQVENQGTKTASAPATAVDAEALFQGVYA